MTVIRDFDELAVLGIVLELHVNSCGKCVVRVFYEFDHCNHVVRDQLRPERSKDARMQPKRNRFDTFIINGSYGSDTACLHGFDFGENWSLLLEPLEF